MSYEQTYPQLPAPCIIDFGIVAHKEDMRRLLTDLNRVRYIHTIDGELKSEGEGWILEVFCDPTRSTLVANQRLYLNIQSFDYLELYQASPTETYYDLIQDNRQLRLIPLSNNLHEGQVSRNLDAAALEAMVTQVLSAKWDVQLDDDDCPF